MSIFLEENSSFSLNAEGKQWCGDQLLTTVEQWRRRLDSMNLEPRARVALYGAKSYEFCAALLAVFSAGYIAVPIFYGLSDSQVEHILQDAMVSAVLADASRVKRVASLEAAQGVPILSLQDIGTEADIQTTGARSVTDITKSLADTSMLVYTSGSTGKPKGIELSKRNLILGALSVSRVMQFSPRTRVLCVLPLSFDAGLNQLLCALVSGSTAVLHNYVHAEFTLKAIETQKITTLLAVPGLWAKLIEQAKGRQYAGVELIGNTGGAWTKTLQNDLNRIFPNAALVPMYGFSEAFRGLRLYPDIRAKKPTSVGRPIPYASAAVVKADGSLCAPGEIGELVQFGPLVSNGYWRNPEANQNKFRPCPDQLRQEILSSRGRLYHVDPAHLDRAAWSGDLVRIDEEGDFHFIDRKDDLVKHSGFRINPGDVESVCSLHLGAPCVVVVIPDGDSATRLILVTTSLADSAQLSSLRSAVKTQLPSYMIPQGVVQVPSLAITPNGKLDRPAIAAMAIELCEKETT